MNRIKPHSFAALSLLIDAVGSGALAVPMALAAEPLGSMLGLPAMLLRMVGIALLPYAMLLTLLARRAQVTRRAMPFVIGGNVLWVAGSMALLLGTWLAPNALGQAFILAQAMAVAGFAALQVVALRRAPLVA